MKDNSKYLINKFRSDRDRFIYIQETSTYNVMDQIIWIGIRQKTLQCYGILMDQN